VRIFTRMNGGMFALRRKGAGRHVLVNGWRRINLKDEREVIDIYQDY
jgi:hypothetical protein